MNQMNLIIITVILKMIRAIQSVMKFSLTTLFGKKR